MFPRLLRGAEAGAVAVGLRHLPRSSLLQLYRDASEDLAQIEVNIRECESRIQRRGVGPALDPDGDSWNKVYGYYADMNKHAREEIVDFLGHRIQSEAIREAHDDRWLVFGFHVRYQYRVFPDWYHPDHYSDVSNKFSLEPVLEGQEWKRCHAENPPEFLARLQTHLMERKPWESLRRDVDQNHRLNARREILLAAVDAYQRSEWSVFSTLAVVQIEGLFWDYCEDLGVAESELKLATLPSKLQAIRRMRGSYHDFPYYAHRLPVRRNHLAHGRLLDGEKAAETAHLLLLDLLDVSRHVMQRELLVNVRFRRLQDADSVGSATDAIAVAFLDSRLGGQPPPSFYNIETKWKALRDRLDADDVAELASALRTRVEEYDHMGAQFLQMLKELVVKIKRDAATKERWTRVLAGWPIPVVNEVSTSGPQDEWELFSAYLDRES